MKIIKAHIEVIHPDATSTQYVGYPKIWLDNKERIPALLIPNDRSDEVEIDGKLYQIVYPVVPDDLAGELLKLPLFTEVTKSEVKAYSDKHYPKRERINEIVVLPILVKKARNLELSKKEQDALDPLNPEPGVTMTEDFVETAAEYGITNS